MTSAANGGVRPEGSNEKRPQAVTFAAAVPFLIVAIVGAGGRFAYEVCGPERPPPPPAVLPVCEPPKKWWQLWKRSKTPAEEVVMIESAEEPEFPAYCSAFWKLLGAPHRQERPVSTTPVCHAPPAKKKKKKKRRKSPLPQLTGMELNSNKTRIIRELSDRVQQRVPDFLARARRVPWGNSKEWWLDWVDEDQGSTLDGGRLLYSYLRIMKWPEDLAHCTFPFRLCKHADPPCPCDRALEHTLEWREVYQPWKISPLTLEENRQGFVYTHGITSNQALHPQVAIVWTRPGSHKHQDPIEYFRAIINTLDRAVALSPVGKFMIVLDAHGFKFSYVPPFAYLQQAVVMLQDHFPDRLAMVVMLGLSTPAEIVFSLIKPLLTKEVRDKIKVIHNVDGLRGIIDPAIVPKYLGGSDSYEFDSAVYYQDTPILSETEATAFLTKMPYHAL